MMGSYSSWWSFGPLDFYSPQKSNENYESWKPMAKNPEASISNETWKISPPVREREMTVPVLQVELKMAMGIK